MTQQTLILKEQREHSSKHLSKKAMTHGFAMSFWVKYCSKVSFSLVQKMSKNQYSLEYERKRILGEFLSQLLRCSLDKSHVQKHHEFRERWGHIYNTLNIFNPIQLPSLSLISLWTQGHDAFRERDI